MRPKAYGLIFSSYSSTGSLSSLGKGNLGLYVGESVFNKIQSFSNFLSAEAIGRWDNRAMDPRVGG